MAPHFLTSMKIAASAVILSATLATMALASGWSSSERLERARSGLASATKGDLIYVGGGSGAGVFGVFTASDAVESFEP
ncbi:MAG: hypothetical protein ACK6A4_06040 [Alphaproteobacteria bacterium]